jgi:tetratricopeptide (TPR) repeat protein
MDLLTSLVEKSLVMMIEGEEGTRYRMLETMRDYSREKLELSGETADTAGLHCQHYFALAKEANKGLRGPQQAHWLLRLEAELDNLRAATALALAGGVDSIIAVKLAVAMQGFWILRGYATEGRSVVRSALALPDVQAADQAHAFALYVGAALAECQSDYSEARQMLESCLLLRRKLGNPLEVAATLSTLSLARLPEGDVDAARAGETEALDILRQNGNRVGEAIGLLHLGQIDAYAGDDIQAQLNLEKSLAIARQLKHAEVTGECELMLGEVALRAGDHPRARATLERSLSVCQAAGDRRGVANATWWLGKTDLALNDLASASLRLGSALRDFVAFEMREPLLGCLQDHALLAQQKGQLPLAVSLAAAAVQLQERLGLQRPQRAQGKWQEQLGCLRLAMASAEFDAAWTTGRAWELEDAVRSAQGIV